MCNPMFVPTERMTAVCGADRRWSPDPADHRCTCEYPSLAYYHRHLVSFACYLVLRGLLMLMALGKNTFSNMCSNYLYYHKLSTK